jgi:hypothetical protein
MLNRNSTFLLLSACSVLFKAFRNSIHSTHWNTVAHAVYECIVLGICIVLNASPTMPSTISRCPEQYLFKTFVLSPFWMTQNFG